MQSFESKLSLFISIDLVGSTSFKYAYSKRSLGKEQPWLEFFDNFYKVVPFLLRKNIGEKATCYPTIWKTAGDEILFHCDITDKNQPKEIILALYKTINEYHDQLAERNLPLKIKATSWIAGFPVINAEITIDEEGDVKRDYIGPSIDVGFRLSKFSDPRNLIISIELAYILSDTLTSKEEKKLGGIFLENEEILKGAFKGLAYPILTIKIQDTFEKSRLKVLKKEKLSLGDIEDFCLEYIAQVNDPYTIVIPYIKRQNFADYNDIPDDHDKIIKSIQEKEKGDYEKKKIPKTISDSGKESVEFSEKIHLKIKRGGIRKKKKTKS
ncbi:hypothetical protein [Leptospira dzoumogneensis]|uniref:Guanylate cyclase domain-containing protein n=1 Tax=Leptospira dzoumogneensis TaxID=2484904 RepID=A0A4Z1AL16_9LEPT|nr:hypothetical protein [Leptospira dzoumogneensis]TGM97309.1 hypothetical protein EHR06_14260 [Leptospira dzoumogneensis]